MIKVRVFVALSKDLLAQVDRLAGPQKSRSDFIERVLHEWLLEKRKPALHTRDLARINRAAKRLNLEAADVLEYQGPSR